MKGKKFTANYEFEFAVEKIIVLTNKIYESGEIMVLHNPVLIVILKIH